MSNLMTETELAKRLNVSLASVRRWRLERRGPAFVKVGALVRYRPEDLDTWAERASNWWMPSKEPTTLFGSSRRISREEIVLRI